MYFQTVRTNVVTIKQHVPCDKDSQWCSDGCLNAIPPGCFCRHCFSTLLAGFLFPFTTHDFWVTSPWVFACGSRNIGPRIDVVMSEVDLQTSRRWLTQAQEGSDQLPTVNISVLEMLCVLFKWKNHLGTNGHAHRAHTIPITKKFLSLCRRAGCTIYLLLLTTCMAR